METLTGGVCASEKDDRQRGRRLAVGYLRAERLHQSWYPPPGMAPAAALAVGSQVRGWYRAARREFRHFLANHGEPVRVPVRGSGDQCWWLVFEIDLDTGQIGQRRRPRTARRCNSPRPEEGGPRCSA